MPETPVNENDHSGLVESEIRLAFNIGRVHSPTRDSRRDQASTQAPFRGLVPTAAIGRHNCGALFLREYITQVKRPPIRQAFAVQLLRLHSREESESRCRSGRRRHASSQRI